MPQLQLKAVAMWMMNENGPDPRDVQQAGCSRLATFDKSRLQSGVPNRCSKKWPRWSDSALAILATGSFQRDEPAQAGEVLANLGDPDAAGGAEICKKECVGDRRLPGSTPAHSGYDSLPRRLGAQCPIKFAVRALAHDIPKSVLFGELFPFSEFRATIQLTHDAEIPLSAFSFFRVW